VGERKERMRKRKERERGTEGGGRHDCRLVLKFGLPFAFVWPRTKGRGEKEEKKEKRRKERKKREKEKGRGSTIHGFYGCLRPDVGGDELIFVLREAGRKGGKKPGVTRGKKKRSENAVWKPCPIVSAFPAD